MATNSNKSKLKPKTLLSPSKIGLQQIDRLWEAIPTHIWLNILRDISPDNRWEMISKLSIKGRCPWHEDQHPSLVLSFNKKMGKCFAASCGHTVRDPVKLICKLKKCSYSEALSYLSAKLSSLNIEIAKELLSDTFIRELNKENEKQEMYKEIVVAFNKFMQLSYQVYKTGPEDSRYDEFSYCFTAFEYLEYRLIPMDFLSYYPLGIFGKPIHIKPLLDSKYHDNYDTLFSHYNNNDWWGWLVFHYNNSPNTISSFKFLKADKSNGWEKTMAIIKDPSAEDVGLLGMYTYKHLLGRDTEVYITEGEFDFLSLCGRQYNSGANDIIIFATSGMATYNFRFLSDYNIKTIWFLQDHPTKNGDAWVKNILKNTKRNVSKVVDEKENFVFKVFTWPVELTGLDLDELCKSNSYTQVKKIIYDERNNYFLNSNVWVTEKAIEEMKAIKNRYKAKEDILRKELQEVKIENSSDGNANEKDKQDIELGKLETALKNLHDEMMVELQTVYKGWLECLHASTERRALLTKVSQAIGIELEMINDNSSVYDLNTVAGATEAFLEAIKDNFSIGYAVEMSDGIMLYWWSKNKKSLHSTKLGRGGQLIDLIELTITSWAKFGDRVLKNSLIYLDGVENLESDLKIQMRKRSNLETIAEYAMGAIASSFPMKDNLIPISQGIHYKFLPTLLKQKGYVYFINGNKAFRGKVTHTGDNNFDISWEEMEGVSDGELVLFENFSNKEYWSNIKSEEDFNIASRIDHKELYQKVYKIIDKWRFKHDTTIKKFLTCQILAFPILSAINCQNIVYVTGEKNSGKSSLVKGIFGGLDNNHAVKPLIEHVRVYDSVSAAGMYQSHNRSGIGIVIDEQENSGAENNTSHDKQKIELLRYFYNIPFSIVKVIRGSASSSDSKYYQISCPIILAGINPPEGPTFLSRVVTIHTEYSNNIEDPAIAISKEFKEEELDTLCKEITVAYLAKIPYLAARKLQLKERLRSIRLDGAPINDRFITLLLGPLLIYEDLGFNPEELLLEMYEANKNILNKLRNEKSYTALLEALMYERVIPIRDNDITSYFSVENCIKSNLIINLNATDLGVKYLPDKRWLIVNWKKAQRGVLKDTPFSEHSIDTLVERINELDIRIMPQNLTRGQTKELAEVYKITAKEINRTISILNIDGLFDILDNTYAVENEIQKIEKEYERYEDGIENQKHVNLNQRKEIKLGKEIKLEEDEVETIVSTGQNGFILED